MQSSSPSVGRLALGSTACVLTVVACITLHELIHLGVGRLFGLPCHFLGLTSAGLDADQARAASATALAWMNGVAPLFTMASGIVALFTTAIVRRRGHNLAAVVLAWTAVFGLPYIGIQLMMICAPVRLRGQGADSAAVLVGYFGITGAARALIAASGAGFAMVAGFWLPRVLDPRGIRRPQMRFNLWRVAVATPRRLLATLLVMVSAALIAWGATAVLTNEGSATAAPFALALVVWAVALSFAVRWRSEGARLIRDRWIVPGAIASATLGALGTVYPSDYTGIAVLLLPQLAAAAFVNQHS